MKLFQHLLVAPAALGLFSPLAANATEINLNEIANYSDVESIEIVNHFDNDELTNSPLLAGGEGLVSTDSYDGGFSETTTASLSVDFGLGLEDGKGLFTGRADGDEDLQAVYSFQIDLNTSFTGEDSLDISLDAGNGPVDNNGTSTSPLAELDLNNTTDLLTVDGVSYTFPVGDNMTAIVGDNTDGSALFTTACAYGGPSNTLDDCGNVNAGITGGEATIGGSYDFGNGFTAAAGFQTSSTAKGVFTDESSDAYAFNTAYTADSYGVSITYGVVENDGLTNEDTYTAFNAYYTPEGSLPSISVGYELGDLGGAAATADEKTSFFVGLTWDEVGPGSAGIAVGHSNTVEDKDEEYQYEAYYSYPVNDGMTITPLIFTKDNVTSGLDDTTGIMVKTSFSF